MRPKLNLQGVSDCHCLGHQLPLANAAAKSRKAAAAVRAMHTVAQDVELPRKGLRSASVIPCDKRATGLWPIKRLELHERSVVWQQKGCCVVVGHAVGRQVAGQRQARLDGP